MCPVGTKKMGGIPSQRRGVSAGSPKCFNSQKTLIRELNDGERIPWFLIIRVKKT
jgi:hypothetical protein